MPKSKKVHSRGKKRKAAASESDEVSQPHLPLGLGVCKLSPEPLLTLGLHNIWCGNVIQYY